MMTHTICNIYPYPYHYPYPYPSPNPNIPIPITPYSYSYSLCPTLSPSCPLRIVWGTTW